MVNLAQMEAVKTRTEGSVGRKKKERKKEERKKERRRWRNHMLKLTMLLSPYFWNQFEFRNAVRGYGFGRMRSLRTRNFKIANQLADL